jgi:SRSO17 transposase
MDQSSEIQSSCFGASPKVHIPETVGFQTKPEIAANLIHRTAVLGTVSLDWITADEAYGRNGDFLDELEALEQPYIVEVPVSTTVWTTDPASCVPEHSGRGRVPSRPTRESVSSVAESHLRWPIGNGIGCVSAREPKGR